MEAFAKVLGVLAFIGAAWAGIMWCIWSLWCWVLPQVYAGGPQGIVSPGFWLFAAAWTLIGMLGRSIFGSKSKE